MLERMATPRSRAVSLVAAECTRRGITIEALRSGAKSVHLVKARVHLATRLHLECGMTPGAIGDIIGRERTTVAYYLSREMRARKSAYRAAHYRATHWVPA